MIDFQTLNCYRECLAFCELEVRLCESHLEATRQAYLQCEQVVIDRRAKLLELRRVVQAMEAEVTPNQGIEKQRLG